MLVVLVVRVQQLVPPREGGGVVPHEVHVVEVVETGAGVEWDQVERVLVDVASVLDSRMSPDVDLELASQRGH